MNEHKEGHNKLAQVLLEKEVLFAEDVESILGKRPWKSRSDELLLSQPLSSVEDVPEVKEDSTVIDEA